MSGGERVAVEQMLVHNLKGPLTGLIASLELLHEGDLGPLTDAQRRTVRDMQDQAEDLHRMVDALLDLGHLASPEFRVHPVPVDLHPFLARVRGQWSARLPRLTSDIAADVPAALADPDVLARVLDNLLLNVLVHAGPDIPASIRVLRVGDAVRLLVADEGPGIPEAERERVFDPYVTRSGGHGRSHGLGLAYCRAALAVQGGTIHVDAGDRGTTVVVDLPAAVVLTRQSLEQDQ